MRYFVEKYRASLIRFGAGTVLSLITLVLCIAVIPSYAPADRGVLPFILFGVPAAYMTAAIIVINDNLATRIGAVVMATFFSFLIGNIVGSGSGLDVVQTPDYGMFLGITCGALALAGGGIGFIFPPAADLTDLGSGWRVAIRRY